MRKFLLMAVFSGFTYYMNFTNKSNNKYVLDVNRVDWLEDILEDIRNYKYI